MRLMVVKQYNGKAVVRLVSIYACIDMETGDVLAKGSLAECSKALEEV